MGGGGGTRYGSWGRNRSQTRVYVWGVGVVVGVVGGGTGQTAACGARGGGTLRCAEGHGGGDTVGQGGIGRGEARQRGTTVTRGGGRGVGA